MFKLIIVVV